MAMKKSTPGSGNAGGRTRVTISPSVAVLGAKLPGFASLPNGPRKSLTPAQLKEANALAAKLKAREVKAANEKKANAKIIKKQNKSAASKTSLDKQAQRGRSASKPVIKVTPPKKRIYTGRGRGVSGMGGLGGGGMNWDIK